MRALACAILFLTRIPLPELALREADFRASPAYFAWVGALIALLLALAMPLFAPFSPRLASLLLVCLWVLVTGGLHLDGLADTIDGLSGGRGERERALAIMRDSRIGSHGALALVLVIALKWAALDRSLELGGASFLVAPVLARFGCTLLIARFPYARGEGLGRPFVGAVDTRALAIGFVPLLLTYVLLGGRALAASALALLVVAPLVLLARRTLGGLTGDVYGAAIELTELGVLLACALPSLH